MTRPQVDNAVRNDVLGKVTMEDEVSALGCSVLFLLLDGFNRRGFLCCMRNIWDHDVEAKEFLLECTRTTCLKRVVILGVWIKTVP